MKLLPRFLLVSAAALLLMTVAACREDPSDLPFQGYAEAELTYVASPRGGRLLTLAVQRGDQVTAGQRVFTLDDTIEAQSVREADQALLQARHNYENLTKGARPSELEAMEARLRQAQSSLELSTLDYRRKKKLVAEGSISESDFDRAQSRYLGDKALVAEAKAQLETARLGARSDEVDAARAQIAAAEARVDQARWNLGQMVQDAPAGGKVFDTYFNQGEWVGPRTPVASLLQPDKLRVRFFVPEEEVSALAVGREVALGCDGCPSGMKATINYISPEAEYTPPVIFSLQTRSKLVFMVEARPTPDLAASLHPGQPMDVRLISGGKAN